MNFPVLAIGHLSESLDARTSPKVRALGHEQAELGADGAVYRTPWVSEGVAGVFHSKRAHDRCRWRGEPLWASKPPVGCHRLPVRDLPSARLRADADFSAGAKSRSALSRAGKQWEIRVTRALRWLARKASPRHRQQSRARSGRRLSGQCLLTVPFHHRVIRRWVDQACNSSFPS